MTQPVTTPPPEGSPPPPVPHRGEFASKVLLGLTAVFGLAGLVYLGVMEAQRTKLMPDGAAPPSFQMERYGGGKLALSDLRGKVVMLDFWATWCPPCRTEMPMMQRLHERYGDRVLIVGVDFGEERGTVTNFIDRYGITYPILLDPTLENFYRWSPQFGLPKHYFVDANGVVLREIPGELPPEAMLETLDQLLGDAPAPAAPSVP